MESVAEIDEKITQLQTEMAQNTGKIQQLQDSLNGIRAKYAPKAMNDAELESRIAQNRTKRIKKSNDALMQWNWQKNREDAENRFQQSMANSNNSQVRMKVNGAASDIRNKQIAIANDFRQMTSTIDPFARKAYEDKILTDLDQMQLSYETLAKSYSPEQLAEFGLTDMKTYSEKVREAIKNGQFSADADFSQVQEIQTDYDKQVRAGTLTDQMKNVYLQKLQPLIAKGSKEAFALRQKINGGETGKEILSREVQANQRARAIQKGNERADAKSMTLDELLAKWPLDENEQKTLDAKYTTQNQDAESYNEMDATDKAIWKGRNKTKWQYLRNKGLI